jgi:hypothetical protein
MPLQRTMNGRIVALLGLTGLLVACDSSDLTITRGAEDARGWTQRLAAAVPLATPADSAREIMERNGFRCRAGADSVAYLWCDKESGGTYVVVRRRWQAVLNLDAEQRVFAARGFTGLIGP